MNKIRIIFYLVFALFQVGAFIFTLLIQDFGFLTSIFAYIKYFKFITFFGILLILADFIWAWVASREAQKEKSALIHELNTLKARLYDLQETEKPAEPKSSMKK